MASGAYAAITSRATTIFPSGCCTTSANCKASDHDSSAADRQCDVERNLRGAPGMGVRADPAEADRQTPGGDADGVRDVVRLPGVLPGVSCASGKRALSS